MMTNESLGLPLERYIAVNALMMRRSEEKYLDCSYQSGIDDLRQTSWKSDAVKGGSKGVWEYTLTPILHGPFLFSSPTHRTTPTPIH